MGQELLVRQQMPLGVLHADGGVHGPRQAKVGHVPDDQLSAMPAGQEPVAQEPDVLRGEVEPHHLIAPVGQPGEMGAGPTGDVQHPADRAPCVALEGVDEEVHLSLAVHVEGDLVELGRACTSSGPIRPTR